MAAKHPARNLAKYLAAYPCNVPAMAGQWANAMLPNVRQDGSQDNLPCAGLVPQCPRRKLARQLAICPRNSRAAVRATANATSRKRLVGIPTAAFNHDIQKL